MNTISRRQVIQGAAAATALPIISAQADSSFGASRSVSARGPLPVVAEKVRERFSSIPFEAQQIDGLFGDRMRVNVEGRLLCIQEYPFLSGFIHREDGGDPEGAWVGEHVGKFLDAACNVLRYRDRPDLRRLLDRVAKALMTSQGEDGYLGTYPAEQRWTSWDVWVHKYNLIGLLSYYKLTSDTSALTVCRKMGDLLVRTFGEEPGQRGIISAGAHMGMAATSVLEPMCELYRYTGEQRFLDFSKYVVRAYDHPDGPRIVTSLLDHGSVHLTANGKAYEMLSNFNGLVDLYRLTEDESLLKAVLRAWGDIVKHQLYPTGAASVKEIFQPADRLLSFESSHVGETCVTVTWLQLNWRLLRLTGEARFAEEIERVVYNHLLAAQDARNGDFTYYTGLAGRKDFSDEILCCVSSGPRGICLIPQLIWGVEDKAFAVHLYTAGHAEFALGGVRIKVQAETQFPVDGEVNLKIDPERTTSFTLRLRVPHWTTNFTATIGSKTLRGTPGKMLDITQTWQQADSVKIRMELPVRMVPAMSTYPDYIALRRGPQVLAMEKGVNRAVPYLHRVAPASSIDAPVNAIEPPPGWPGRQVYELDATVGLPSGGDELHLDRRKVRFVPFADAMDYRVWMLRADRMRRDTPAVTAFERARYSFMHSKFDPAATKPVTMDMAESLIDENPSTHCVAKAYRGTKFRELAEKRGYPVWFSVMFEMPKTVTRVVFRHGPVGADGGWFDTSMKRPFIEVVHAPVRMFGPTAAVVISGPINAEEYDWEQVAEMDAYPVTNASTVPEFSGEQSFEVQLANPVTVFAVRLVGIAGGDHVSCAELSAYA